MLSVLVLFIFFLMKCSFTAVSYILCCLFYSDRNSSQLVIEAENLLQHSAVHDAVLVQYFKQLVTGHDTGQLHIDSLYRQFIITYIKILQKVI